jgi:hypothetical protein
MIYHQSVFERSGCRFASRKRVKTKDQRTGSDSIRTDPLIFAEAAAESGPIYSLCHPTGRPFHGYQAAVPIRQTAAQIAGNQGTGAAVTFFTGLRQIALNLFLRQSTSS